MSASASFRNGRVPTWPQDGIHVVPAFRPTPIFFRGVPIRRADPPRGAPHRVPEDQDDGTLPQAGCQWAQAVWLPRLMRALWMYWAPARPERLIGQIS